MTPSLTVRDRLEQRQLWCYLPAVAAGLLLGQCWPDAAPSALYWLLLGLLLYAVFAEVPLTRLRRALAERRFLAAILATNFLLLPPLVWLLSLLGPADPAMRLGILLVLLVPCTDWFLVFTRQAGGRTDLALVTAPLLLLGQFLLLPLFLLVFLGSGVVAAFQPVPFLVVLVLLLLTPFLLALVTQWLADRRPRVRRWHRSLTALPVPLLALVLFLVAWDVAPLVPAVAGELAVVAGVFTLYVVLAVVVAYCAGGVFRLRDGARRTLMVSAATRNSFVVLPLALALPGDWRAAVAVVVLQPVVELAAVLVLVAIMKRREVVKR